MDEVLPYRALPGFEQINRYWDQTLGYVSAKLMPGDFYVTREEEIIVTVLGSCVSACLWDPTGRVGGMNHFMLPERTRKGDDPADFTTRYGSYAMEHLINEILKNGGRRERLLAKITGGGQILQAVTDIGRQNIDFVQRYLKTEGIELVGSEVGDIFPRKVYFNPMTGKAQVKKLHSLHNDTIYQRETDYQRQIRLERESGAVDLF